MPEEGDFIGGQAVGFVDEVAQAVFQQQGFACLIAGGFDRPRVFVAQALEPGGRERVLLCRESVSPRHLS